MAQGMVLVQLRLPKLVYEKLKRRSDQVSVSMNRYVIRVLRSSNMTKARHTRRAR